MVILNSLIDFVTIDGFVKTIELGLVAWGCYIAYRGLKTWREQVIEAPKIQLARETIEQFYKMRDLVKRTRYRHIICYPEVIKKYYENDKWSDHQCACMSRAYVLDQDSDQIKKFQEMTHKAKVYFSQEIEKCFAEFNYIINYLPHAIQEMTDIMGRSDFEEIKGTSKVLYLLNCICENSSVDETNKKMDEIIQEVEYNLKPIYEPKAIQWKNIKIKNTEGLNDVK